MTTNSMISTARVGALLPGPRSTTQLARAFIGALDKKSLADSAEAWILASKDATNPVERLRALQGVLRDQDQLPAAIVAALALCLREAPNQGHPFENPDRLPLSRAKREAQGWGELTPAGFVCHMLEIWIMAQHAYWSVGRGLVVTVASGKAGDEDASIALPDGEAWGAVGVGRTRTHRRATVPGSAQRADKIDEFLSGFERDQGHWLLLSRSLLPLASLLGRSILAASLSVMRNRRAATLKESNLKNAQAERGSFIDSWILRFGHHL